MAPPLVTVIMTCLDHEPFVERALDAVCAQTHRPIELIVADDGSTDASADRIEQWLARAWPEATFLRHPENRGLCRTLNEALAMAHGTYVSITSADDWMEPERLERLVEVFEASPPQVGLVYSGLRLVNSEGKGLVLVHHEPGALPDGDVYRSMIAEQIILTPTALVRRSVYDVVGGYEDDDIVEDYDMWLRVCRRFEVRHVPGVLVNFRWHDGNTTTRIQGAPYDTYVATCLRRQLGHSPEIDDLVNRRLASLTADNSS